MTREDYHRLTVDFVHCLHSACPQASSCARHSAGLLLEQCREVVYHAVNIYVIKDLTACPHFLLDQKVRYAWGISRIFDNLKASDLREAKSLVMGCLGRSTYYHVKRQIRVLTPEEQLRIRGAIESLGYDGSSFEFDRYEEAYPFIMRLSHRRS